MTDASSHSFEGHLERGDLHAAADWLVRAHGRDVLHLCTAIVRDRGTAEDLAQDAFGKAFLALPEFRGDASARTWLLTIARHRCLDHLRRSARQPWSLGREDDVREPLSADTEEELVSDLMARRADIREGLAVLSESERAMVLLRFAHGLSFDEIAESFGVKSGAVRMRVGRALTKMRDAIEGEGTPAELQLALTREPRAVAGRRPAAAPPAPAPSYSPPSASAAPLGAPSRAAGPGMPEDDAASSGGGVRPVINRILEAFRGPSPGATGTPPVPPPSAHEWSLEDTVHPAAPPPLAGSMGAFAAAIDPRAALGALLLAFESDTAADDAFLARLDSQLPGRS